MGECYKWRAIGQYARGDSYSFSHGTNRGQKAQLSSLAPKRPKHRLREESRRKVLVPGDKVLLERKARSVQKKISKGSVRIRRAIFGILPYGKITNLNRDPNLATNHYSDKLKLTGSLIKSRRKGLEKDHLPY